MNDLSPTDMLFLKEVAVHIANELPADIKEAVSDGSMSLESLRQHITEDTVVSAMRTRIERQRAVTTWVATGVMEEPDGRYRYEPEACRSFRDEFSERIYKRINNL